MFNFTTNSHQAGGELRVSENTLVQLYVRFLLNLPPEFKEECRQNFVRIFCEIELAHWFYLDYCLEDPSTGGVDMLGLTKQLFDKFPALIPPGVNWQEKFVEWRKYRGTTSTGSVIIIDSYKKMVLLVQGFHKIRWTFPGGKVNQNESLEECAAREAMEETGLDVAYRINTNLYIDRYVGGTLRRAYIVEGLPRITRLSPATRNEIEAITWFNIADLPTHIHDNNPLEKMNIKPCHFFFILPFVKQLQAYLEFRKLGLNAINALTESAKLVALAVQQQQQQSPVSDPSKCGPKRTKQKQPQQQLLQQQSNRSKRQLAHSESDASFFHTRHDKSTEGRKDGPVMQQLNLFLLQHGGTKNSANSPYPLWNSVTLNHEAFLQVLAPTMS